MVLLTMCQELFWSGQRDSNSRLLRPRENQSFRLLFSTMPVDLIYRIGAQLRTRNQTQRSGPAELCPVTIIFIYLTLCNIVLVDQTGLEPATP